MTSALVSSNAEHPLGAASSSVVPGDTLQPGYDSAPPDAVHDGATPPRESGMAPRLRFASERTFSAQADDHVQLAVAESAHTEANLSLLLRNAHQLCSGLGADGEAIVSLGRELDAARELLAHGNAEQMALRSRVRMLQEALECARGDADRERALFIEQEDAFLRELLGDHARELSDLRQRLGHALESPSTRARLEQGDPFPKAQADSDSGALRLGSVRLRSVYVPQGDPPAPADTVPAPPLDVTLPPPKSSKPTLRKKPEASTRPLVEYKLSSDQVAEEHLGSSNSTVRSKIP
jgi:hypothetical protein